MYKVDNIFYYRKRINKKLYRISLQTQQLKTALERKKLLNIMSKEELLHTLKFGDYQYIFEYDTEEEFERRRLDALKTHREVLEIENELRKMKQAHETLNEFANNRNHLPLSWFELEAKFLQEKREIDKVKESTYKAYASTFKKLQRYFGEKAISDITIDDFKAFRNSLKSAEIKNATINNHFIYINSFIEFAVNNKLIKENNVKAIKSLKEEAIVKENFTYQEVNDILQFNYEENVATTLKILMYSGMRIDDVHRLTNEDIKEEEGIKYFNVKIGKSVNAARKVPIHESIIRLIEYTNFPLFPNKSSSAMQKKMLRELYRVIEKGHSKTIHTCRANFIAECINNFPEKLLIIQEIVGHSKHKGEALTIDTYGKGFNLNLKQEIVNSVTYQQ